MAKLLTSTNITVTSGNSGGTSPAFDGTGADLIIVTYAADNLSGVTVSDSQGNTYASDAHVSDGSGFSDTHIFSKNAPSVSNSMTVTLGGGAHNQAGCILVFKRATTKDQVSAGGSNSSASTIQGGSITPGSNFEIVIASVCQAQFPGLVFSINQGFIIPQQVAASASHNYGNAVAYLIQTTATAQNPTWTATGTTQAMGAINVSYNGTKEPAGFSQIMN